MKYHSKMWLSLQMEKGVSISEMAEKCKVTRRTIERWLSKHGLTTYKSKKMTGHDESKPIDWAYHDHKWLYEQLYVKNLFPAQVAKMCNVSKLTIISHAAESRREYGNPHKL